MIKQLHNVYN